MTKKWLIPLVAISSLNFCEASTCITRTKTGKVCQNWLSQTPHKHTRTPSNYPDKGLDRNCCANPTKGHTSWCYTTSSSTRWEYCESECGNTKKENCSPPAKPLKLYRTDDMVQTYKTYGGFSRGVSIWTVGKLGDKKGFYRLGDIAVGAPSQFHSSLKVKPKGYILKVADDAHDAVKQPTGFSEVWFYNTYDAGFTKIRLYKVNCPSGYGSLGYISMTNSMFDSKTPKSKNKSQGGTAYCINKKYLTLGRKSDLDWKWNDAGSGASKDVAIFEQDDRRHDQISVRGFSTTGTSTHNRNYKPAPLYVLKVSAVSYSPDPPVKKTTILSVKYDFDRMKKTVINPVKELKVVRAKNRSNMQQSITKTSSWSYEESQSWGMENSLELGVEFRVLAKVPLVTEFETTLSAKTSHTFTSGSSKTTTITDETAVTFNVGPKKEGVATVHAKEYTTDIPYTARVEDLHHDDSRSFRTVKGVFRSVNVAEVEVTYSESRDIV